ncbi:hypothetical protein DIPPA_16079 [Diplonema papillatum]|nr:hypothetical protein DIPPA_16079 [Diplonema papillatum]|eukprot:gene12253-18932_t
MATKLDIPTLSKWQSATSGGMLSKRGPMMKEVDKHIAKYHKATSDYGRNWEAGELRIALDAWQKKKGPKWASLARNSTQAVSKLHDALPAIKVPTEGTSAAVQDTAENLRKGTLYFLATSSTNSGIPNNIMEWASSAHATGQDIAGLVGKASPASVSSLCQSIKANGIYNPEKVPDPPATPGGVAAGVIGTLQSLLGKLGVQFPGEAAAKAVEWIQSQLTTLVSELLGGLTNHLALGVSVVRNLGKAAKAGYEYFKAKKLESGILSGQPSLVITSVGDQIMAYGLKGLKDVLMSLLMAGVSAANPAIGAVANAIRNIMSFVIRAFLHFLELYKIRKLITEAKKLLANNLHKKPKEYTKWYTDAIRDLPVLSCYCLAMPTTGSYFGFMSQVSNKDESQLTQKQLKANHDLFEGVKVKAKEFVKAHSVKLSSCDPVIQLGIDGARGVTLKIKK